MRFSRWLVPVAVVAVVAGAVGVSSAVAGSAPAVPERTPAEVLALAAASDVEALSGTVQTHADLGLPALPSGLGGPSSGDGPNGTDGGTGPRSGSASAADPQAVLARLLSGRSTLRVWVDGPQRQRIQLLDRFAEVSLVHAGRDVWAYDTNLERGTHYVLPSEAELRAYAERRKAAGRGDGAGTAGAVPSPGGAPGDGLTAMTPQALAERLLGQLDPTTAVTLDPPQTVAGRAAYTLVVTPRTDRTLVERAVLAVDAGTGLPLRVQVYARGHSDPVLERGFSAVDLTRPDADRFRFRPPAGAQITTRRVSPPASSATPAAPPAPGPATRPTLSGDAVRVVGSGWTAVVELRRPADAGTTGGVADLLADPMVQQLTRPVDGGRALRTALFSVLLTADGRVLVGAVPVDALVVAAG